MGVPLTTTYRDTNNTTNTQTNSNITTRVVPATSRLIEVMPADEIKTKEGELLKYKNMFSGWGKRYMRLERTYLHYFETKHTHQPLATITRGEISQVKQCHAFQGRTNVFEIIQKNGVVWYFQAKSHDEMVSWMQSLSNVPVFVAPDPYPAIPCGHTSQQQPPPSPMVPPVNNNEPPPRYESPYRDLMREAHHTAFVSHTPHQCTHDSPPPPYNPEYQPR